MTFFATIAAYHRQPPPARHRSWFLLGCFLIVLPLSWAGQTMASVVEYETSSVQAEGESGQGAGQRIQIRRLQQGISQQKELAEDSREQERDLLAELEGIDLNLQAQQRKAVQLERQAIGQQIIIDQKIEELNQLTKEKAKVLDHLRRRVTAYYKMGKIGLLNVTFSTETMPDLLKFHDSFRTLILYDEKVLTNYRTKIAEIQRAKTACDLEKTILDGFLSQTVAEQKTTQALKDEKENLLALIKTEQKLHDKAIQEMEAAANKLSASLIALNRQEQSPELNFSSSKGQIPPPVDGSIIGHFNEETTNKLGIKKKSAGIAISAPDGSKVQAVSPGIVVFAGYLRGYGNTIIVSHGMEYYTVTARLEQIAKKKGDHVDIGTTLGYASDTATLIDEGLYFEIRHEKESLNPLEWLDTQSFSIASRPTNR